MSTVLSPRGPWRRSCRSLKASAVAVVLALMPVACDNSEATIDTASLTRAAASLALSVGELVERYATAPSTRDWREDRELLRSIIIDDADALDFGMVRERFSAAASVSREAGNGKRQTARQLVAAAKLASDAFRPPRPDYRPGDQGMLAEIASSLEPQLRAALTSTYNFETGEKKLPTDLDRILPDALAYVLIIAAYNYADQKGSRPIRDRMRTRGERDPPAEFIDPAGNLRLPQGSEPDKQISQFEEWRTPSDERLNELWHAAAEAVRTTGLPRVFKPAAEKALEHNSERKEVTVNRAALTRASASLALSVGEFAELYATEPPSGDGIEEGKRMRALFDRQTDALGFEAVRSNFLAAASGSRKEGNGKVQTARQLLAAVHLSSAAFRPPQPDYTPGDEAMLTTLAARLETHLDAALTSTYDFSLGRSFPSSLDLFLVEGFSYVLMVANYNYVGPGGSHPIRDRMRTLGMEDPPAEFLDPAGNLRLPHGSEPREQVERFESWREGPIGIPKRNWLWTVAMLGPNSKALGRVFDPAAESALK